MKLESKLNQLGIEPLGSGAFQPLSREEISDIEALVEAKLPKDYKDFLVKYGASSFPQLTLIHPENPPPKHISRNGKLLFSSFYGSNAEGHGLETYIMVLQGRMPGTVIPIGRDHSGNNFCLGVGGKDKNRVFLWDFESEPAEDDYLEQGLPVPTDIWYQNLTQIASSFSNLIERIVIEADSPRGPSNESAHSKGQRKRTI